ncbi:MAG: NOB1 family endonuclease [Promethearchaeota archaeon]
MIALKNNPILIFDTNIFLLGINFNVINGKIYTTPNVIEEVKHKRYINKNRNIITRIQAAIESKKLVLQTPTNKFNQEIDLNSKTTGDYKSLSFVDKELIALALELKLALKKDVVLYTNDYSMQNLCSELNITFLPLIRDGIKSRIIWEVYCPFCNEIKTVEEYGKDCEICGTQLKRKKKSEIKFN